MKIWIVILAVILTILAVFACVRYFGLMEGESAPVLVTTTTIELTTT